MLPNKTESKSKGRKTRIGRPLDEIDTLLSGTTPDPPPFRKAFSFVKEVKDVKSKSLKDVKFGSESH